MHGSSLDITRRALLLAFAASLAAGSAAAQESVLALEFSFSNPGARSLGLGGAFVALADDATAAFANPAGLIQLTRPEVSVEGRGWSYSTPYTAGGRAEGEPSGFGIDDVAGLRMARSEEEIADLSFLSLVYPQKRWAVAFYRHQLASFEFSGATQGLFAGVGYCCRRSVDQRDVFDLDVVSYAVSGAYRLNDAFSLGLSLVYFDGSMTSVSDGYLHDAPTLEALFSENSYLPERRRLTEHFTVDDGGWGGSAGVLWSLSDSWKLGAFLRHGAELDMNARVMTGPALEPQYADGTVLEGAATSMILPDVWGLGLAYRSAGGRFTLGLEWDRVEYSDLLDSAPPDFERVLADGDELRAGAELVILRSTPMLAARLGAWLEPDHRIRYTGDEIFSHALRQPGDDELHVAAGLGLVFARFQLDLGVDLAERVDTVSLSTVYRL